MEDELIKKTFKEMKKKMPRTEKCPDEDNLARYVEGIMDEEGAKRIKEHVLLCSKCSDEAASLVMALNKVDSLSIEEALPEVSDKQIKRASAIVKDRERGGFLENISSNLERITQFIRDFFSFGWVLQPIPVAVKSGAAAFIVILIVSTTYFYYQQGEEMTLHMEVIGRIRVASERGIPKEGTIEKIIKEGDTLNSNDYFQIKFELDQDAYIYILYYGSTGKFKQLPLDLAVKVPQKIKGNKKYTIPPERSNWFRLDKNIGTETVFILASNKPIINLKETLNSLQGLPPEEVLEVFKTKADVVKKLSFKHQ